MQYTQSKEQRCPFCKQCGTNHKQNCPYYKKIQPDSNTTFGNIFDEIFKEKNN